MKGLVLDTSALFYGKDLPPGYELVISPGVAHELQREGMGDRLEMLLATRVRVLSPSKRSADRVRKEAEGTGDSRRLSETDIEVLALALELGYQIVTDDYSIQNLATVLGVPFRGLDQKGIGAVFEWEARCKGCGKRFPAAVKECDICGSETRTARKRKGGR